MKSSGHGGQKYLLLLSQLRWAVWKVLCKKDRYSGTWDHWPRVFIKQDFNIYLVQLVWQVTNCLTFPVLGRARALGLLSQGALWNKCLSPPSSSSTYSLLKHRHPSSQGCSEDGNSDLLASCHRYRELLLVTLAVCPPLHEHTTKWIQAHEEEKAATERERQTDTSVVALFHLSLSIDSFW